MMHAFGRGGPGRGGRGPLLRQPKYAGNKPKHKASEPGLNRTKSLKTDLKTLKTNNSNARTTTVFPSNSNLSQIGKTSDCTQVKTYSNATMPTAQTTFVSPLKSNQKTITSIMTPIEKRTGSDASKTLTTPSGFIKKKHGTLSNFLVKKKNQQLATPVTTWTKSQLVKALEAIKSHTPATLEALTKSDLIKLYTDSQVVPVTPSPQDKKRAPTDQTKVKKQATDSSQPSEAKKHCPEHGTMDAEFSQNVTQPTDESLCNEEDLISVDTPVMQDPNKYYTTLTGDMEDTDIRGFAKKEAILELIDYLENSGKEYDMDILSKYDIGELHDHLINARDDYKDTARREKIRIEREASESIFEDYDEEDADYEEEKSVEEDIPFEGDFDEDVAQLQKEEKQILEGDKTDTEKAYLRAKLETMVINIGKMVAGEEIDYVFQVSAHSTKEDIEKIEKHDAVIEMIHFNKCQGRDLEVTKYREMTLLQLRQQMHLAHRTYAEVQKVLNPNAKNPNQDHSDEELMKEFDTAQANPSEPTTPSEKQAPKDTNLEEGFTAVSYKNRHTTPRALGHSADKLKGVDIGLFTPQAQNTSINVPPTTSALSKNEVVQILQENFKMRVSYGIGKDEYHTPSMIQHFVKVIRSIDERIKIIPWGVTENLNDNDIITNETQIPDNETQLQKWVPEIEVTRNKKLKFSINVSSAVSYNDFRANLFPWCKRTGTWIKFDKMPSKKIFSAGWFLNVHPQFHNRNALKKMLFGSPSKQHLLDKVQIYSRRVWQSSDDKTSKTFTDGVVIDGSYDERDEILKHLCEFTWPQRYQSVQFIPFRSTAEFTSSHQQTALQHQNLYLASVRSKNIQANNVHSPITSIHDGTTTTFLTWLRELEHNSQKLFLSVEETRPETIKVTYNKSNEYSVSHILTRMYVGVATIFGDSSATDILGNKEDHMRKIDVDNVTTTYSAITARNLNSKSNPQDDLSSYSNPPPRKRGTYFGKTTQQITPPQKANSSQQSPPVASPPNQDTIQQFQNEITKLKEENKVFQQSITNQMNTKIETVQNELSTKIDTNNNQIREELSELKKTSDTTAVALTTLLQSMNALHKKLDSSVSAKVEQSSRSHGEAK